MRFSQKLFLTLTLTMSILLIPLTAQAAMINHVPDIRVMLRSSSSATSYTMTVYSGSYNIVSVSDPTKIYDTVEAGGEITFTGAYNANGYTSDSILMAVPADNNSLFRFNNVTYRGAFKTMSSGTYYYAINVVDVEKYLYGVIGREMGYSYHRESLAAQAIASRSYAISQISSRNKYYDVTATISDQVYGGYSAESDKTRAAVDETRGQTLMYNNEVIQAFFSSNHGGYSENVENVWLNNAVPIKGVPSPYDAKAGEYSSYGASCYSWTVEFTPEELVAKANKYDGVDIGEYVGISVSTTYKGQTSVSRRAMVVTIKGTKGSVYATKDNIRIMLNLKSTLFTVNDNTQSGSSGGYVIGKGNNYVFWESLENMIAASAAGTSSVGGSNSSSFYAISSDGLTEINKKSSGSGNTIVFKGFGYGHGVGMSQWGAIAMGDAGYTAEKIIEHYYCSGGIKLVQYYN